VHPRGQHLRHDESRQLVFIVLDFSEAFRHFCVFVHLSVPFFDFVTVSFDKGVYMETVIVIGGKKYDAIPSNRIVKGKINKPAASVYLDGHTPTAGYVSIHFLALRWWQSRLFIFG
jgi:hypothetical protein